MAGGKRTNAATAAAAAKSATPEGQYGEGVSDAAAPAPANEAQLARHQIRFDATGEIAYHGLLEGALDRWHRIIMAIVIISGTASLGSLSTVLPNEWSWLGVLAPLVVVVVSTLDFVFDLPGAARLHRDLKGRLHETLAMLEICDDPGIPALRSQLQRIYAMQPPPLRYAQALAYNTAVDATYQREKAPGHYEPIPHLPLNPLAWVMRVDRAWVKRRGNKPDSPEALTS